MEITQEYLRSILKYDLLTGLFYWRVNKTNYVKKGDIAGCVDAQRGGKRYIAIIIDRKKYCAHRLAFLYVLSAFPENQTDHINGDGTDNRWINLRPVSSLENHKNRRLSSNNTSGHLGVYWSKNNNKWYSQIKVNGKLMHLGYFLDISEAIFVRKKSEKEYGFHENHGQVRPL